MNKIALIFLCLLSFGPGAQANRTGALRELVVAVVRSPHLAPNTNSSSYLSGLVGMESTAWSRMEVADRVDALINHIQSQTPVQRALVEANLLWMNQTFRTMTDSGTPTAVPINPEDAMVSSARQILMPQPLTFAFPTSMNPEALAPILRGHIRTQLSEAIAILRASPSPPTARFIVTQNFVVPEMVNSIVELILQGKITLSQIQARALRFARLGLDGHEGPALVIQGTEEVTYRSAFGSVQNQTGPNLFIFSRRSPGGWAFNGLPEEFEFTELIFGNAFQLAPLNMNGVNGGPSEFQITIANIGDDVQIIQDEWQEQINSGLLSEVDVRIDDILTFWDRWQRMFGTHPEGRFLTENLPHARTLVAQLTQQPLGQTSPHFQTLDPADLNSQNILIGRPMEPNSSDLLDAYLIVGNGRDYWVAIEIRADEVTGRPVATYSRVSNWPMDSLFSLSDGSWLMVERQGLTRVPPNSQSSGGIRE